MREQFPVFDLHCDTAVELSLQHKDWASNDLHIDPDSDNRYVDHGRVNYSLKWDVARVEDLSSFKQYLAGQHCLDRDKIAKVAEECAIRKRWMMRVGLSPVIPRITSPK